MTEAADTASAPDPRANPELVGHAAAEATLRSAHEGGRLAHAWLLRGPRGIGKATLAFRFARWLLASAGQAPAKAPAPGLFGDVAPPPPEAGQGLYVPPTHPVVRRITAGGHADLMTIDVGVDDKGRRRREIVAGDVREVGRFLAMTPAEGGWRVIVIDSADDMNRHAANAVLKALEEPPKRAILILVSHNPGRLLPTIRSRCRSLALHPLSDDAVDGLLATYSPDLGAGDRAILTRLAEGSIGRALELAGEGGLDVYRDLMGLIGNLPDLDVPQLHRFTDKLSRQDGEKSFRAAADLLRWWLARLIAHAAGRPSALPEAGEAALFARIARRGSLEPWLEVWENVTHLLARTDAINLDRRQVMMSAVLAVRDAARV